MVVILCLWYPDWEFYLETHNKMIEEFGGYYGLSLYPDIAFAHIINEVKQVEGLYEKAGTLLDKLRNTRLVDDGLRRTAFTVTASFLEMNDGKVAEMEQERIIIFMKEGILRCDSIQIARWLEYGEI